MALVLAGGSTRDLSVLTEMRAVTALPFGGKYRVIDFTLSNLCNSEIYPVGLLTQHAPLSLHAHVGIGKPWDMDRRDGGVLLLQPYQRQSATRWYLGTADAVRQNLDVLVNRGARWVLILPGDLVYKMDYSWLLKAHQDRKARMTLAVGSFRPEESGRFGIATLDGDGRISEFREKPEGEVQGLGFMGIVCVNTDFLIEELEANPEANNFVTDIIQPIIARGDQVDAYRYEGYWEDVGTLDVYYRASMDLLQDTPRLNLYDPEWVIYTRSEELPPAHIGARARIDRSLLANGCEVLGTVENSILFPGVRIEEGAVVRDSIVMNDTTVASGALMDRAVVDKHVRVGKSARVGAAGEGGLTVLGRDSEIPDDIVIGARSVVEPSARAGDFGDTDVPEGSTVARRSRDIA